MNRRGFTLIELLVASMLSVVLMGGVLMALGGLARDAKKTAGAEFLVGQQSFVQMLQWDLSNARTMIQASDAKTLVLIGHGGIDPDTLAPNGRLARVIYFCRLSGGPWCLLRRQEYLDDPIRPRRWTEIVASGVTRVSIVPAGGQTPAPDPQVLADGNELPAGIRAGLPMRVPQWVRIQVAGPALAVEKLSCVK
ncbi:MAG TPA: prepilin-type N-terminal cleavage/methylation domain-containing protein [Tepidisphaeraceae bacterium]|nr:prepilin-type N-terminal cleavage/methylation domain-containing protein [Tepidisphaeraceae bacterium]